MKSLLASFPAPRKPAANRPRRGQTFSLASLLAILSLAVASCDTGTQTNPAPNTNSALEARSSSAGDPAVTGTKTVLPSGLEYTVLKEGQGESPRLGAAVVYHLTGWLADGREFWDTRKTQVPQRDILHHDQLIAGLVEALLAMKPGERRKLVVPSHLAYGDDGYPHVVPPRSDLSMDVELVSVEPR